MRNSSRTWLQREIEGFSRDIAAGALVLDAGAGSQPYRANFAHCRYEAADFERVDKPYATSTYVCDLASVPVEDNRFDAIVFSQVMEHLAYPKAVLAELERILKPGGKVFMTAPLFYEEHEQPYDFFRYTQFGWRHLLGDAGFSIERIGWMEGYLGTVSYQLETASRYLPVSRRELAPGALGTVSLPVMLACRWTFRALSQLFARLDEKQRFTQRGFPKNYIVIATKP